MAPSTSGQVTALSRRFRWVRIPLASPVQSTDHLWPHVRVNTSIDWKEDRGCAYRQVDSDRMDRKVVKVRITTTTAKTAWIPARPSNKAPLIHWDDSNFFQIMHGKKNSMRLVNEFSLPSAREPPSNRRARRVKHGSEP